MSQSRLEGKVGLFVFLGIILLVVLLLSFSKSTSWFTPTYELRLKTTSVGGIKERSGVLLAGVSVGNVDAIELADGGKQVVLRLRIRKRYPIYHDAKFAIQQIGVLGDQFVAISPQENKEPLLQDGAEVTCEEPFSFQEAARSTSGLIQRMDQMSRQLSDAIERISRQVLDENTLSNLSLVIHNMRRASEAAVNVFGSVNRLVETNAPAVSISLSNLVEFSGELSRFSGELRQTVNTNKDDLEVVLNNLQTAATGLKDLTADLQAGKGLLGSLLKDEKLKDDAAQTIENLNVLSSNLNKYGLLYRPRPTKTTQSSKYPFK
jgi:phospholipid/cholesterol/gamma-HCH transport system substrate-binding protein